MCIAAAAVPFISLGVSAVSTVASIGLGIAQANQQSAIAQQQANLAVQQQNAQVQLAQQQMNQQALQQFQQQNLQREMQRQSQQQAFQQQMAQMQQQQQMQLQSQQLQASQMEAQMRQQAQQQAAALQLQQKQGQDNYNLAIIQANAQIANQYKTARQQVLNERGNIMAKNAADRMTYQKRLEFAQAQVKNNNEAANRVYEAEQTKLQEAKKKAAFEQQAILAKSIGDKGSILATGRTGQSVGLLVNDVERQAGFALAQQAASLDSARDQAIIAMEGGWLQGQSANNQAVSQIGWAPDTPYLPSDPEAPEFVNPIGLGIGLFPEGN